ncbi:c-type cytochrome [Azohydromonas caseinilytica]|uniref:Cytochrome c n=1 Tax=Azohydromonas caseinilytica TaxID=2728836 RepID=A0A848FEX1_9BURK|nr:cytochrome c [Azohydromonas caseinilytica]NML18777.1 cytochrome c [Azohydromonas caseinilytica]
MTRPLSRGQGLSPLLALLLSGAALAQSPATSPAASSASPEVQQRAQRFYAQVCARCHETGIGPVITGRNLPAAFYVTMARSGLNAMPAFRLSDIDDPTLQALGEYLSKTPAPAQGAQR